jgi:hypothetical protein
MNVFIGSEPRSAEKYMRETTDYSMDAMALRYATYKDAMTRAMEMQNEISKAMTKAHAVDGCIKVLQLLAAAVGILAAPFGIMDPDTKNPMNNINKLTFDRLTHVKEACNALSEVGSTLPQAKLQELQFQLKVIESHFNELLRSASQAEQSEAEMRKTTEQALNTLEQMKAAILTAMRTG